MSRAPHAASRARRLKPWLPLAVAAAFLICGVSAYGLTHLPLTGGPASAPPHRHAHRPAAPAVAAVTVSPSAAMLPVPRSYLGISTEYWALPAWAPQMPLLRRVLSLLRVPGDGPFVVRVGGDSADHSFWDPRAASMPPWAYGLAPRWLARARALIAGLHARLILDLNLITDSPAMAAQWARAAEAGLPRGSITGFEVGNEPDIYSRAGWRAITAGRLYLGRTLPHRLTPHSYAMAFRAYAAALESLARGTPLAGPALSRPLTDVGWVRTLLDADRRSVGLVTVHRYPYSACVPRRSHAYPTIGRVLSPTASEGVAASVAPAIDAAHDAGLALRMTELNSVTCGGLPGVSDAFATALWAPDTLFALLRAGADGVNLHVRADTINAPFALGPGGLVARPLLYGLVFFARSLGGPDARLVDTTVRAPASFRAYAVRAGGRTLHVVLIDKGRRPVRVSLRAPATAPATVARLTAPSPHSTTGTTLAGRHLDTAGRWVGTPAVQRVVPRAARYTVEVPRFSAALVTMPVTPGTLGASRAGLTRAGLTNARRSRAARTAPAAARARHR